MTTPQTNTAPATRYRGDFDLPHIGGGYVTIHRLLETGRWCWRFWLDESELALPEATGSEVELDAAMKAAREAVARHVRGVITEMENCVNNVLNADVEWESDC